MAIFAGLWWLWLIGLLLCGAFAFYQWLTGFLGAAKTIAKAASLTLEGVQVVADNERTVSQRAEHVQKRLVDGISQETFDRFRGVLIGMASMALAGAFALLLILSVIFSFLVNRL